jgi:hypothetical protein
MKAYASIFLYTFDINISRGFYMKTKILITVIVLALALSTLALAQTTGKSGATPLPPQSAQVGGSNASNMNAGYETTNAGYYNNRTTSSAVTTTRTAGTIETTGTTGDFNRFWNIGSTPVTGNDRTILVRRANAVLGNYNYDNFVMTRAEFDRANTERSQDLYIIDVSKNGNAADVTSANVIKFSDLTNRFDSIPAGRTVVVFADNDVDGAATVTVLRMLGYNAWYVERGTTGAVGTTGTTGTTRTAGTTGTVGTTRTTGTTVNTANVNNTSDVVDRKSDSPLPPQ